MMSLVHQILFCCWDKRCQVEQLASHPLLTELFSFPPQADLRHTAQQTHFHTDRHRHILDGIVSKFSKQLATLTAYKLFFFLSNYLYLSIIVSSIHNVFLFLFYFPPPPPSSSPILLLPLSFFYNLSLPLFNIILSPTFFYSKIIPLTLFLPSFLLHFLPTFLPFLYSFLLLLSTFLHSFLRSFLQINRIVLDNSKNDENYIEK